MRKCIILIMTICMLFSLVGCGADTGTSNNDSKKDENSSKHNISLKEYAGVNVEGYNGCGEIVLAIDEEEINKLVEQEKIDEYIESISRGEFWLGEVSLYDLIDFDIVGETSGLSNGDDVKIVMDADSELKFLGESLESMQKALKINFAETEFQIKVSGLKEAKVLDVMSFVDEYVVYNGANGGATAWIEFPKEFVYEKEGFSIVKGTFTNSLVIVKNHKNIASMSYSCGTKNDLSEGDELTISVECDDIELGDTGYIINTEKTIKVPNLGNYLSAKEELNPKLKQTLDEEVIKEVDRDNLVICKYYFGTLKESATSNNIKADECRIFVLASFENSLYGTIYRWCSTSAVIQLPDGSYKFSINEKMIISEDPNAMTDERYDLEEIDW